MKNELKNKIKEITNSGLSIYDPIEVGDEKLWLTSKEVEVILNHNIVGYSLKGLDLRSRSKVVKEIICSSLGYPVPKSFKKTQPRFLGQKFDVYTQKSNNLQVWNEELDLSRRYVLIQVGSEDIISCVKVITGAELAPLDTTGTLTQKYQAQLKNVNLKFELVSKEDNLNIFPLLGEAEKIKLKNNDPTLDPINEEVLPIEIVFERLKKL